MPAKLYLDEDLSPRLAEILRLRGYDVISAHEVGLLRASDEQQLTYASLEERIIVSYNIRDYSHLANSWFIAGKEHPGILLGHTQFNRTQVNVLARALENFLRLVRAEDIRNIVRYVEEFLEP